MFWVVQKQKGVADAMIKAVLHILVLAALFWYFRRNYVKPPPLKFSSLELESILQKISKSLVSQDDFLSALKGRRILLVGETHYKIEAISFFISLLSKIKESPLVLLLELPAGLQPYLDSYLSKGEEKFLAEGWEKFDALPYKDVLRWAWQNKNRIVRVVAMDEGKFRIRLTRLLLTDTRNATMANHIFNAYQNFPNAKILVYGGQLHMLLSGRYRYDVENREPAGHRLLKLGLDRNAVSTILLAGVNDLPIEKAWALPGILSTEKEAGILSIAHYIDYPIFKVKHSKDAFDYLVHLGRVVLHR